MAQGTGLGNYDIKYAQGTLRVEKKELTITANDGSKIYGEAVIFGGAEFTADGLENNDEVTSVTLTSGGAVAGATVDKYDIVVADAQGTGLDNYEIGYEAGTLTVDKKSLIIAANDGSKIYGEAVIFDGTEFTVDGLVSDDEVTSVTLTSGGAVAAATAGEYGIVAADAQGTGLGNYDIKYAQGTLRVEKKELTITANDGSKIYGEAVIFDGAEFTADGLENNDEVTSVTLTSGGAVAGATVDKYDIVVADAQGTGLDNYEIGYEAGTLTVDKKSLIIAANDGSKIYGEAVIFDGAEFTVDGLVNNDEVTSVALASDGAAATALVDGYDIAAADAQGTGLGNYDIKYAQGTLRVEKKELTITANDGSKIYGEAVIFGGAEFTADGLENDDEVTSVTLTSGGAVAGATVDKYDIVVADAQGTGLDNYEIGYEVGTLTVDKKSLSITANDGSKIYGGTVAFDGTEFTVSGLVNDDVVTSVMLTSDGASATAVVDKYGIVAADARGTGLGNYEIGYEPGTLTVKKKSLTIAANDGSKIYGEAVIFDGTEFTADGLENNDVVTSVMLTSDGASATTAVGDYSIEVSGAQGARLGNYRIDYDLGTLAVGKRPLTVTVVEGQRKIYGADDPELMYTASPELIDGDTFMGTLEREAGEDAGEYAIKQGSLSAGDNYEMSFSGADFVITPAAVTDITFEDGSFVYDGTEHKLSITGEVPEGTSVSYANNSRKDAGKQEVTATISGGHQETLLLTATLTVDKKPLTITANDENKTYGGEVIFDGTEFTAVGLVSDDKVTSVALTSDGAVAAATAGEYDIVSADAQGTGLDNYIIGYETGTLTVDKKKVRVTATSQSKTYGETITFDGTEFTASGLENGDGITYVVLTSDGAAAAAAVGGYGIEASRATGTRLDNYMIDYEFSTLVVDKRPLTVTVAKGQRKIFGQTDPKLTYTFTAGLVEGDSITGSLARNPGERVGAYKIMQGSLSAGTNYEIAFESDIFTITPATLMDIELNNLTVTYDGYEHSLFVSGAFDGATVTYTGNGQTDAGTYTVTALVQKANYNDLGLSAKLVIDKATRSIMFPELPEKTYGDADFDPGALPSTRETVIYTSSNPEVATIVDGRIRIMGAGTAVITATLPENDNYSKRPEVSRMLVVHRAPQTITLEAPVEVGRGAGSIPLEVRTSSGLPVELSIDGPEVATLEGKTLHIHRLGTVRITAEQPGDGNHGAAEPVTVTVRVTDPESDFPVRVHPAVSPNGDGVNEYLIIEGIRDYPENRVRLFNRNGTVVWEASGYNNDRVAFRGIGTGQQRVPEGTYFYVVEVKANGTWEYHKGYFVLRY